MDDLLARTNFLSQSLLSLFFPFLFLHSIRSFSSSVPHSPSLANLRELLMLGMVFVPSPAALAKVLALSSLNRSFCSAKNFSFSFNGLIKMGLFF